MLNLHVIYNSIGVEYDGWSIRKCFLFDFLQNNVKNDLMHYKKCKLKLKPPMKAICYKATNVKIYHSKYLKPYHLKVMTIFSFPLQNLLIFNNSERTFLWWRQKRFIGWIHHNNRATVLEVGYLFATAPDEIWHFLNFLKIKISIALVSQFETVAEIIRYAAVT